MDSDIDIVSMLLRLEHETSVDFTSRSQPRVTILTEADAVNFASNYATGWKTPINLRQLGQYKPGSVAVNLYESINGFATRDNILYYYANDTIAAIAAVVFQVKLEKILDVVSNIWTAGRDWVAQKNGTLTYFTVNNTRTKTARINGNTYYWAGWDKLYHVYSGDKATKVEPKHEYVHPDYNNDITYFGEKALASYNDDY